MPLGEAVEEVVEGNVEELGVRAVEDVVGDVLGTVILLLLGDEVATLLLLGEVVGLGACCTTVT